MHLPLEPGIFYHIYNRGINGEALFKEQRNYPFFLNKYAKYLGPVVDTYAYCLLNNHFHLLIRVKKENVIQAFSSERFGDSKSEGLHSADFVVNRQFARFFSSYTQSINKAAGRTGGLMETAFKRIKVDKEDYLTALICYIHTNPKKHGFVENFSKYPYSSYQSLLSSLPTQLKREAVLDWFGSKSEFIKSHTLAISEGINSYALEEA